jgi:photosystem II stability/assembly factor-like uncharacterized protein
MFEQVRFRLIRALCALLVSSAPVMPVHAQTVTPVAARHWTDPTDLMLLGAAHAGSRIVAVGEAGAIVLSDDDGRHFRQAASVPVNATLTALSFANSRDGWAVGQWGVILVTHDGGEHWMTQRVDTSVDQPLFSVMFTSERDGLAVGLWSLMLATHDGGKTWNRVTVPPPPGGTKADRNLYRIFAAQSGALYVAAEQGTVLKSNDGGATWRYLDTGYRGSLWAGTAMADGRLLVAGLRGKLYQSADEGATWSAVATDSSASIADLEEGPDGVMGVGLDGAIIHAPAGTMQFRVTQRPDRAALTAVLWNSGNTPVMFSKAGVLSTR